MYLLNSFQADFLLAFCENKWPRRVVLSDGEYIMMHNANVMVHFVPNNDSANWSGEDTVTRPKVVRRGVGDIEDEIDDGRLIEELYLKPCGDHIKIFYLFKFTTTIKDDLVNWIDSHIST